MGGGTTAGLQERRHRGLRRDRAERRGTPRRAGAVPGVRPRRAHPPAGRNPRQGAPDHGHELHRGTGAAAQPAAHLLGQAEPLEGAPALSVGPDRPAQRRSLSGTAARTGMNKTVAITGATGFVGAHLIRQLAKQGWDVRALTRRNQVLESGITWVKGSLEDEASLTELVRGANACIHVAGAIKGRNRDDVARANIEGT